MSGDKSLSPEPSPYIQHSGDRAAKAESWVAKGPNQPIAPDELESALGEERIQWLMEQTGMQKDQLLAGLSSELPDAVDELTPEGRLPTDAELTSARPQ